MWTVTKYDNDQMYSELIESPMISNVIGVVKAKISIEKISAKYDSEKNYEWSEARDKFGEWFPNMQLTGCYPENAYFIDFRGYELKPFITLD